MSARLRALLVAALIGCAAGAAEAQGVLRPSDPLDDWPRDPVYVFYPRDSCRGGELELEVWSRRASDWVPHPAHAHVPVESCQLEDAGVLWNELRRRCIEPPGDDPPSWIVGLDVFDPKLTAACAVSQGEGPPPMAIEVASPAPGVPFRAAEPVATVRGNVLLDGLHGAWYDVVIAIDTSRPDERGAGADRLLLQAQIAAARTFIHRSRPRMGDVRIGLVTFPGPDRGLPLGSDVDALEHALLRIASAGTSEPANLARGLTRGLNALGDNARAGARRRLLLSTDGRRDLPFGLDERQAAAARSQLAELARTIEGRDIALHLFALDGLAADPSPLVRELTADRGRYTIVAEPATAHEYLLASGMPYVTWVAIRNRTTGEQAESVRYGTGGEFEAELALSFGANELVIEARNSADQRVEIAHALEFDGSLVRERLLEVERERIERLRGQRDVTIEPAARDDREDR